MQRMLEMRHRVVKAMHRYMDEYEFAVALHLIRAIESGGESVLPETLPRTMIPTYASY